jgi:hypothetical protein
MGSKIVLNVAFLRKAKKNILPWLAPKEGYAEESRKPFDLLFYEYWLHHGITEASFVLFMICTIFLRHGNVKTSFYCSSSLTKTFRGASR